MRTTVGTEAFGLSGPTLADGVYRIVIRQQGVEPPLVDAQVTRRCAPKVPTPRTAGIPAPRVLRLSDDGLTGVAVLPKAVTLTTRRQCVPVHLQTGERGAITVSITRPGRVVVGTAWFTGPGSRDLCIRLPRTASGTLTISVGFAVGIPVTTTRTAPIRITRR